MTFQSQLMQYILSGITIGSIYALVALGFVVIYNVTGIINFAQGEFVMLGAFITITLSQKTLMFGGRYTATFNLPLPVAALLGVISTMIIGIVLYRLGLRPAHQASVISLIIITIGASIALRGIALLAWGTDPFRLPVFTKGKPIRVLGAIVTRQSLWVMATAALILLILYLFFEHTMTGKAFRASAVNPMAARLMGIDTRRMALLSFALSAAVGAIGGIVITPSTFITYDRGLMLSLKGFVAAIMGGLGSAPGAVLGGLLLGVLETMGAGLISSGYKDAIAFLVLFIILFVRLSGVFRGQGMVAEGI